MSTSSPKLCVVFGGSGFVGKHAVRALVKKGWRVRVATRSPHTEGELRVMGNVGQVQLVQANLRFKDSVAAAMEGADAVVNAVGVLFEEGRQSFNALHAMGAQTIASAAAQAGITNLVHISAIIEGNESEYAQSKRAGTDAVRNHVPNASIVSPSIVFGPEDQFFNKFAAMAQFAPALPLIGGGETMFQPVYVGDVAQAIATIIDTGSAGDNFELGGPRAYSFKELLQFTLDSVDRKRFLAPMPWFIANMVGFTAELGGKLPFVKPFLTRDQVISLRVDNVVSDNCKTFADLKITPESIEAIVPAYLERYRKYGQFHKDAAAKT